MPAYDPDELPKVADSIVLSGVTDSVHEGYQKMDRRLGNVELKGWYQRLGLLMDRYRRDGIGERFYEELYRCRMDELGAEDIAVTIDEPDLQEPLKVTINNMSLTGGIQPPRGTEKVHPVTMLFNGINFNCGEVSGNIGRLDIRDILAPDPAHLTRLTELARSMDAEDKADDAASEMLDVLMDNYGENVPFTLLGMQTMSVKASAQNRPVTLNNLSYTLGRRNGGYQNTFKLNKLQLKPESLGEIQDRIRRFIPDGFSLDMSFESQVDTSGAQASCSYAVNELGSMKASAAVQGDMLKIRKQLEADNVDVLSLLNGIRLESVNLQQEDSGLLAFLLTLATEDDQSRDELLAELRTLVDSMTEDQNPVLRTLGQALQDQLEYPGYLELSLKPQPAADIQKLSLQFLLQPGKFPLEVTSRQGTTKLVDYLTR
jgi:hypothetical protein